MGIPLHYSLELPQRCLQLIEELWPYADKTRQRDRPQLGPLTTTFLISMSMPIINLPVERIERYRDAREEGYADDRQLDPRMTTAVTTVLGGHPFNEAPFFASGAWSLANRDEHSLFNIAKPIPDDLADELSAEQAEKAAAQMATSQWCSILRNAMAHGGIAYLNGTGRSSLGERVEMYAFISGKFDDPHDQRKLTALNILRISEANYRAFLRKWVAWLQQSGLAERTAA